MDLAGLEFKGWSVCVVWGSVGVGRAVTSTSLPPRVECRTKGSRVIVIRIGESGVWLSWGVEGGSRLGKLGEIIQRMRGFYRDSRLQDPSKG